MKERPAAKSPRFFCDNCGAEVARGAKTCPGCGRFFASVRCPKCGFTGAEGLFASGCPICGYSSSDAPAPDFPRKKHRGKFRLFGWRAGEKEDYEEAPPLPLWVYAVAVLTLLAVAAAFVVR